MYSAIWSEAAASHVREIVEYMWTENPLVARKLAHAFALFTDLVEHMPEIAPVWKENSRYPHLVRHISVQNFLCH